MIPEREALAEVARRAPGAPVAYGVDHKGPWARVGEATARAKPVGAALAAALQKHLGDHPNV